MSNGDQIYENAKGERIRWDKQTKAWVPAGGGAESFGAKLTAPEGERDPVTGLPKGGALTRGASSFGGTILGLPGAIKSAFTAPMTPEEARTYLGRNVGGGKQDYLGPDSQADVRAAQKRVSRPELAFERLTGALPLIDAIRGYMQMKPSAGAIGSVLPEAIGGGAGAVVGGELTGAAGAGAAKVAGKAAKPLMRNLLRTGKADVEPIIEKAQQTQTEVQEKVGEMQQEHAEKVKEATDKHAEKVQKMEERHQDRVQKVKDKYARAIRSQLTQYGQPGLKYAGELVTNKELARQGDVATKSMMQSAADVKQRTLVSKVKSGPVYQHMNEMVDAAQEHIGELEQKVQTAENAKWDAFKEKLGNPPVSMQSVAGAIETAKSQLPGESVPIFNQILKQVTEEDPLAQASVFKGPQVDVKDVLRSIKNPKQRDTFLRQMGYDTEEAFFADQAAQGGGVVDVPLDNARRFSTRLTRAAHEARDPAIARALHQVGEEVEYNTSESILKTPGGGEEAVDQYRQLRSDWRKFRETFSDRDSPLRKIKESKDPQTRVEPITGRTGERAIEYLGRYKDMGARPGMLGRIRSLHKEIQEFPGKGYKIPKPPERPTLPQKPSEPALRLPKEPKYPEVPDVPTAEQVRRELMGKMGHGGSGIPTLFEIRSPLLWGKHLIIRQLLRSPTFREWIAKNQTKNRLAVPAFGALGTTAAMSGQQNQ
jgi:hypothetical protein